MHAQRGPSLRLFTRAIESGQYRADADVDLALDLTFGPLSHPLLLNNRFVVAGPAKLGSAR